MENVKFRHTKNTTKILMYECTETYLRGAFFMPDRPKAGDLFQSFDRRDSNFVYTYRIVNIISVADSKGDSVKVLKKDPKKGYIHTVIHGDNPLCKDALIEAKVELLNIRNENGLILGELKEGIEVEADIRSFY